jgi:GAF domain-containing protein
MLAAGHHMPLGEGLIGTAAATGETVLRPTLENDPDWHPNPLLPDTKGEMAVPIKLGANILGILDVQSSIAGALGTDDQLLLEGLSGQIAVAIESTRLRQEMDERLAEVDHLYRAMSHEGWQVYRQMEDLPTGFIYNQMTVVPIQETEPAKGSFISQPIAVPGGETIGTVSIADDPQHPLSSEDLSVVQQISEQIALALESARLFDQTQTALAQSEKLFDASRRLTQATDLQELMVAIVTTLGISEANRALLTSFDFDSAGEVEQMNVVANWWNGTGQEVTPIGTRYPLEVIRAMPMFVSPTPVFCNDAFHDERVDATTMELVKSLNLRAVAVLPLRLGSHQIGTLILEAEEPYNFTPDEIRLFTSLAPQIATVLENRQQYERAQRQAEREAMLNAINQKIQSATSVEAVLQIAARELGHALGAPMTIAQLSMKDQN